MANVNPKELIGKIVPTVYIDRIILETKGGPAQSKIDNPHINEEGLAKPIEPPPEEEALVVTVDMVVKEILGNSLVESWFNNFNFLKYLKVAILQSRNKEKTENIVEGKETIEIGGNISSSRDRKFRKIVTDIVELDKVINQSELDKTIKSSTLDGKGNTVYDFTFSKTFIINETIPEHLAYFVQPYLDLESLAGDLKHGEMGFDLPPGFTTLRGKISSERVIEDFKVDGRAIVFFDANGEIWPGETHLFVAENGLEQWKTGAQETRESQILITQDVYDYKIQDFRNFKEIEKLELDFAFVENELENIVRKSTRILNNDKILPEQKSPYFSDLFVTRDKDGKARFLFIVDFVRLVRENTLFGYLINDKTKDLMLKKARISRMRIKRTRTSNGAAKLHNLSNQYPMENPSGFLAMSNGLIPYDNQNMEEVYLVTTSENVPGTLNPVVSDKGDIREAFISVENAIGRIRFFTGVDKDVPDVSYGMYQYGVEMEVEDGLAAILEENMERLIEVYNQFLLYYTEGSFLKYFDPISNRFKPEFVVAQETKYRNDENAIWNVAVSAYLDVLALLSGDPQKAASYLTKLQPLVAPRTGNLVGVERMLKLIETMISKLERLIGTPVGKNSTFNHGIGQAVETYKKQPFPKKNFKIEKYFKERFDSDVPKGNGYDLLFEKGATIEKDVLNGIGLITVTSDFYNERVEKEVNKYFPKINTSNVINKESSEVNINIQTNKKIYTSDDTVETTKYAYLTPAKAQMTNIVTENLLNQGSSITDNSATAKLASSIMNFNFLKQSPQGSPKPFKPTEKSNLNKSDQHTNFNLSSMLSAQNFVIESQHDAAKNFATQKVDSLIGSGSKSVREASETKINKENGMESYAEGTHSNPNPIMFQVMENAIVNGLSLASSITKKNQTFATSVILNLNNAENLLDKKVNSMDSGGKEKYIKSLPNQIKSLILKNLGNTKAANFNPTEKEGEDSSKSVYKNLIDKMNYNLIYKIEYFSSFENSGVANNQVKKPKWEMLTKEKFEDAKEKGLDLLCKVTAFDDKGLGIEVPEGLRLPVYNEYFIVGPKVEKSNYAVSPDVMKKESLNKLINEQSVADSKYASSIPMKNNKVEKVENITVATNIISGNLISLIVGGK